MAKKNQEESRLGRMKKHAIAVWEYMAGGVWSDTRQSWKIDVVKTLNLTVRSFMSADLQSRACAMTYKTLLAIVPAFALVFAIGRGFGFQNLLQSQLFNLLPAQRTALEAAFSFVDSYLSQASEGLFVGVGIVLLLWTLISLMGDVEASFNNVWNVKAPRSFWRKITDYTAILLVLPILMICSSGIQIFMSTALQRLFPQGFMTPLLSMGLDVLAFLFSCLFFAGSYLLIPNTKVKVVNALVAGFLAGTGFTVLQWLFVTGQLYVTKYNAIYGSFAFLPLLMIWMQLVWLITLIGALICYASQNIFRFSFEKQITDISPVYSRKVTLGVLLLISRRFEQKLPPLNVTELGNTYMLPPGALDLAVGRLVKAGLVRQLELQPADGDDARLQPAWELSQEPVSNIVKLLDNLGESDFIPGFDKRFSSLDYLVGRAEKALTDAFDGIKLGDIKIDLTAAESK